MSAGTRPINEHSAEAIDAAVREIIHGVFARADVALEHNNDVLKRCARELPERGRIGIFNRFYYEDVLMRARASGNRACRRRGDALEAPLPLDAQPGAASAR